MRTWSAFLHTFHGATVLPRARRRLELAVAVGLSALIAGCGGGGSAGGGTILSGSFTVGVSVTSLEITSGGPNQNFTVTLTAVDGFSGSISCSVSGLPTGVTATPSSFSINTSGTQQVQLSAGSTVVSGNSTVSVGCTSGSLSRSASFQLSAASGAPGISVTFQPASVTLVPDVAQAVSIQVSGLNNFNGQVSGTLANLPAGVTADSTTFSAYTGTSARVMLTASSGASGGTIRLSANSGALSATAQLPVSINTGPDFSMSTGSNNVLLLYQGGSSSFTFSATPYNGFNQPIAISFSGVPAGVTMSPAAFNLSTGVTQKVAVEADFTAAVNNGATLTLTGTAGNLSHQIQFDLVILAPGLTLNIQPGDVTIPAGGTNSFEYAIFNSDQNPLPSNPISVAITGAPAGMKLSSTAFDCPPIGCSGKIYVEAGPGAKTGSVVFTATYGPVKSQNSFALLLGPASNYPSVPLSTSDQLVSVDTITPYSAFPPPNYLVYHAATNRFFSTDGFLNRLYVVDAAKRTVTAKLTIPGAFGIDLSPDGTILYVGTLLGDIYEVDPNQLTILKRIPSTTISPYGFPANAVYALANGKLLLEHYFLVPGFSWIDGNGPIALWDPATNDITIFTDPNSALDPTLPEKHACLGKFEQVMLTNNRTRVMLVPVLTSLGSSFLCSLDPEAATWNWSPPISGGPGSALTAYALSPDTNTLYAYDGYDIFALDAATFGIKKSIPVNTSQGFLNYPNMIASADGKSVFITDGKGADVLDRIDLASGALTGWIPQLNMIAPGSYSTVQPYYQGIDSGGLAAGVIENGGIGLLDTSAVHPLPVGTRFTQTQLDVTFGPAAGGTPTMWFPAVTGAQSPPLGSIYFGANPATGVDSSAFAGFMDAVTPAGNPGPVDVRTFATDGGSQLLPNGFSYGPWVLEAPTTYSTADGGGVGDLFGFGFGPQMYIGTSALYTKPPTDLGVTVGGATAPVTGFAPNPYGSTYFTGPIAPTNALLYTIPKGAAGTTSTVTVSNSAGSINASQQITYLPAVQQYPVNGQLADGIYDPLRDVYYFTDTAQVRVFSLTKNAWQPSIPIPAPAGAFGPQRLLSLALSPDGSKLAVSDSGALAIYILNPDKPSSIQTIPFITPWSIVPSFTETPVGIALTNSGVVYVATSDLDGDGGCGYMFKLDSLTGVSTEIGPASQFYCLPTEGGFVGGRFVTSSDGSRVYWNDSGTVGYIDVTTGVVWQAGDQDPALAPYGYEVVGSPNPMRMFIDGFFTDSNLNSIGLQSLNIPESIDASYLYGGAFSSDGSLFFQPGAQSIDVFDGRTGAFRARIAVQFALSPNWRALVSNNKDSRLIAITGATGNGIAVVDLNSLPEPLPLAWLSDKPAPVRNLTGTRMSQLTKDMRPGSTIPMTRMHRTASPLLEHLRNKASRAAQLQPAR